MTPESVMCSKLIGMLNMIHSFFITRMLRLAEFGALEAETLFEFLENVSLNLVHENIYNFDFFFFFFFFVFLYFWFCFVLWWFSCVCVCVRVGTFFLF